MNKQTALLQPVPNQDKPFEYKQGYRQVMLDLNDVHISELLVDIADYGIAGQSYYSRPNGATETAVKSIEQTVYV